MNSIYFKGILYTLIFLVLQLWILGSISFFRVAIPFVYPLILLLMPIGTGIISMTIIGFFVGTILDIFFQTPGLHATAMTVVGFIRNYLLSLFVDKEVLPINPPLFSTLGNRTILLWAMLLSIHHIVLYLSESLEMAQWSFLWMNILLGYLFSFLLGLLILSFVSMSYRSS